MKHGYMCSLDAVILVFTSILGHTGLGNTNVQKLILVTGSRRNDGMTRLCLCGSHRGTVTVT